MNRITNTDRSQWIDNDEGLYRWWKSSGLAKKKFISENKEEIDKAITKVVNGYKPAHYLDYGG